MRSGAHPTSTIYPALTLHLEFFLHLPENQQQHAPLSLELFGKNQGLKVHGNWGSMFNPTPELPWSARASVLAVRVRVCEVPGRRHQALTFFFP